MVVWCLNMQKLDVGVHDMTEFGMLICPVVAQVRLQP